MDIKKIFSNLEPWQIGAGVGVILLGVIAMVRSRGSVEPIPQATAENVGSSMGGGGATLNGVEGVIESISNAINIQDMRIEEISGKLTTMNTSYLETTAIQDSAISDTIKRLDTQTVSFNTAVNQTTAAPTTTAATSVAAEASRSFAVNLTKVAEPQQSFISPLLAVALTPPISTPSTPNLGNNGVGYNPEKTAALNASMKNDKTVYNTEYQRTLDVIANREKAGLDTTAQKKYLEKLKNL